MLRRRIQVPSTLLSSLIITCYLSPFKGVFAGGFLNTTLTCSYGRCYFVSTVERTWEAADTHCREQDKNLAKIDSDDVLHLMSSMIHGDSYWIGAKVTRVNQRDRRGVVIRPSCGIIEPQMHFLKFEEEDCFQEMDFICTTRQDNNTESRPTSGCPEGYKDCLPGWCVFRGTSKMNWFLADQTCRRGGGNLIHVDHEIDNKQFKDIAYCLNFGSRREKIDVWNRSPGVNWQWTDGSPVTYTMWSVNEPMTPSEEFNPCVSVFRTKTEEGKVVNYRDANCEEERKFICEGQYQEKESHEDEDERSMRTSTIRNTPTSTPGSMASTKRKQIKIPLIIGIGVGIGILLLIAIAVTIICLRRHHKKELKKVIMRANSQDTTQSLYRDPSHLSDTSINDMSSGYNRSTDIAVITDRSSYQGLAPAVDTNYYERLDTVSGVYHVVDDTEEGRYQPTPTVRYCPATSPEVPAAGRARDSTGTSVSPYDYIDPNQVTPEVELPEQPPLSSENAYLRILPNTPAVTPAATPQGTPRSPRREQEGTALDVGPSASGNVRMSKAKDDDEEGSVIVDNLVYGGRSSKKGVETVSGPTDIIAASQL